MHHRQHNTRRRAPFGRVDENMTMCVARDKQSSSMVKSKSHPHRSSNSVKKSMFHVFGKKKLQKFSASSITQQGSDASSNDFSLSRALQQDEAYTTSMSIFRSEERDASNSIGASSLELMLLSRARPIREDSIGMTSEGSYCLCDDFLDDDDFQQFLYDDSDDDRSSSSSVAIMLSWQDAVEDEIVF